MLSTPGATATVTAQGNFSAVSSLTTTVTLSGTATAASDSMTLASYSLQVQVESTTPTVTAVRNDGDLSTHLSPGVLAAIFGTNLWTGSAAACPATGCAGLAVTVGGKPAYVAYASAAQLNVQIPYELAPGASSVTVTVSGTASAAFPITLSAAAPAFFTQYPNGTGPAIIQTQSGSLITFASPSHPGDAVAGSATGLGVTNPATATGIPAASNPAAVTPSLTIGGASAKILYAGGVKGEVGYNQVNFSVPTGVQGTQPIVLTSGTASSSTAVTIPIAGITRLVSNGGFGSVGVAAPGEIATVFANGLGTTDQTTGFPSTTFQGTQVTFNGVAAPLFHLIASTAQQKPPAEQQIDLLVPQELPTTGTVNMQLAAPSGTTPSVSLKMAAAVPGLYRIQDPKASTRFNIIAQFANTVWLALPASTTAALKLPACDSSLSPLSLCGRPAAAGDYLVIYLTGLGITTPNGDPNGKPLATGAAPPADGSVLYETPAQPAVTIGGVASKILYSGLAPGFPGEYQLDVQVPDGVPNGDDIPVVVTMAGNSDTATLSVQPRGQ